MSRAERPARTGAQEEYLRPLVTVVPYVMLAALAVVTLIAEHRAGGSLLVDLGLCAVTALWILWWFSLHPEWWERHAVMGAFFTGLVVLTGVLVVRDPWFGLFTPACYFYAFGIVPWPWRLAAVAAVALESGTAQVDGVPKDDAVGVTACVAVLAVNVVCMCGLAWWAWDTEQKHEERAGALRQVREVNLRLAATLADNAALQRRLVVQAREAGVLDERQRMAREIHDTLAQGLIGIITQLQAAELAVDIPDRWRGHFAAATRLARESLAEARRSVDALRPQPLETAGLGDALTGVAERWSVLHGVPVQVTAAGTARPMRPEAELALLRAAQEALANVARHAQAGSVALTLRYLEREAVLDVSDDGRGFDTSSAARVPARAAAVPEPPAAGGGAAGGGADAGGVADGGRAGQGLSGEGPADGGPAAGTGGGFGLRAMRERIEALSGTLRVRSEPGSGTTVTARVPHGAAEAGA